jgi:hypothetical protein
MVEQNGPEFEGQMVDKKGFRVDQNGVPPQFPTHLHSSVFWEHLGRAVATFGFLEEVLGRAIFALTATVRYPESEIEAAYKNWQPVLERALFDPLGNLIDACGKAARNHPDFIVANLDDLLTELHKAAVLRNVLCHGSWRKPDADGRSVPLFVNRRLEVFEDSVDVAYLQQTREAVVGLIVNVTNSVTLMGLQFPGSKGPGEVVFKK